MNPTYHTQTRRQKIKMHTIYHRKDQLVTKEEYGNHPAGKSEYRRNINYRLNLIQPVPT
jgi:hypothetical protein